ncbi:MarR family protein [Nonomuraea coxensis DSM 45129]|uniref:MarR family protein n=1 Tax=Nonomuraea coxensis DSM 45129 TaxID=1122611 RepID=A0ABX8U489_9ACTN|nr:helix-turn-helix domain-containing protein [Nonomuraea coxensis]QYC42413.1 MarR family protein [Nonomuraea coxensis DSM 45129]
MEHLRSSPADRPWTFLTNHARVLTEIARDPGARVRDIAAAIGITERAAQNIVTDLERAGYITRTRVGRRTRYSVDPSRPFRHPADADHPIEGLLSLFTDDHPPNRERPDGDLDRRAPSLPS